MRGTGPVEINGRIVYAFHALDEDGFRLRVSLDEWELLGLSLGEWVSVKLPRRGVERVLLMGVRESLSWVWLGLECTAARVAAD